MSSIRIGRINEEIAKELVEIIRTVKDPRVSGAFISIIRVDATADLKYAKVYYSVLGADLKETAAGLKSAGGYIRRELSHRLNLRMTPELKFIYDESINRGADISVLLNSIDIPDLPPVDDGADDDGSIS